MSIIERIRKTWEEKRAARTAERAARDGYGPGDSPAASPAASPATPIITTPWGNVTESARLQAALNMAADPAKRAEVEAHLARKLGSVAAGLAEAQRAYPEAYQDASGDSEASHA